MEGTVETEATSLSSAELLTPLVVLGAELESAVVLLETAEQSK